MKVSVLERTERLESEPNRLLPYRQTHASVLTAQRRFDSRKNPTSNRLEGLIVKLLGIKNQKSISIQFHR